jgi:5'(3')-deoxyribonucleotidase
MIDKKILYIDIDGVLADVEKAYSKYKIKTPEQPYPQSQYGFFMELEIIKDSIETIKLLQSKYDIWFLTAPSFKNLLCYTEKAYWIKNNVGEEWIEKLIICSNKSLLIGDYLIDDHNFGRGQDKFTGELIHFGSDKFKNWIDVYDYLQN